MHSAINYLPNIFLWPTVCRLISWVILGETIQLIFDFPYKVLESSCFFVSYLWNNLLEKKKTYELGVVVY